MQPSRALALAAIAAVLTSCSTSGDNVANDLPTVVKTTSAPPTPTATATPTKAPIKVTSTAVKTASPTPSPRPTTPRPVATTRRPTPAPTTAKPIATPKPPATGTTQLSIQGYEFSPLNLSIPRGTTVRATNRDLDGHTWTSTTGMWDSGNLRVNQSYSYRFMTKGTFSFLCTPHEDMAHGKVTVT